MFGDCSTRSTHLKMWSLGTWNVGKGSRRQWNYFNKFVSFLSVSLSKYLVVTVSVFYFCLPKHHTKFWFNVVLQLRCAGCNSFLDHNNSSSIITWERGRSTSLLLEQLASLYLCTPAMAVYYPSTTAAVHRKIFLFILIKVYDLIGSFQLVQVK
jgi:hypothetical protein